MPPPLELQIRYETSSWPTRTGILRRLRFDEHDDVSSISCEVDTGHRECQRRWLTFGHVYDLFEAAWFRSQPSPVGAMQFDWTFQDIRPQNQERAAAEVVQSQTAEEMENARLYRERERLRDALPDLTIGGPSRVLILLRGWNKEGQEILDRSKRFRADLELRCIDGNAVEWDEVIPYEINAIDGEAVEWDLAIPD